MERRREGRTVVGVLFCFDADVEMRSAMRERKSARRQGRGEERDALWSGTEEALQLRHGRDTLAAEKRRRRLDASDALSILLTRGRYRRRRR